MGSRQLVHTFDGTELGFPSPFVVGSLDAFTGPFTIEAHTSVAPSANMLFELLFVRGGDNSQCWSQQLTILAGTTTTGTILAQVNNPPSFWSCLDWNIDGVAYHPLQFVPMTLGATLTVTMTGAGIGAASYCEYGAEPKQPTVSLVEVTPALIDELGLIAGSMWAVPFLVAHAAAVISLNTLCSGPPFAPETIDQADWFTFPLGDPLTVAERKLLNNFQITLWHFFCK